MPSVNLEPRNKNQKAMPFDVAMRKFKKAVERSGVLQDYMDKEYFEKPAQRRRRKRKDAVARNRYRVRQFETSRGFSE